MYTEMTFPILLLYFPYLRIFPNLPPTSTSSRVSSDAQHTKHTSDETEVKVKFTLSSYNYKTNCDNNKIYIS